MGIIITISVIAILIILNMAACKFYCEKSKKNMQNRQNAQETDQNGTISTDVQEQPSGGVYMRESEIMYTAF